jgi:hypothetical protein
MKPVDAQPGGGLAAVIKHALPSMQALCEPIFGPTSLIMSPERLHFKVMILNDPDRGLVNLFELYRVDKIALLELVKQGPRDTVDLKRIIIERDLAPFSRKSPFIHTIADACAGIRAYASCIAALGLDPVVQLQSTSTFYHSMKLIHDKLENVLVEHLPIPEFVSRFDKGYTTFYLVTTLAELYPLLVNKITTGLKGILMVKLEEINSSSRLDIILQFAKLERINTLASKALQERGLLLFNRRA